MTRGEDEDLCGGLDEAAKTVNLFSYILIWPAGGCGAASLLAPLLWVMRIDCICRAVAYSTANRRVPLI